MAGKFGAFSTRILVILSGGIINNNNIREALLSQFTTAVRLLLLAGFRELARRLGCIRGVPQFNLQEDVFNVKPHLRSTELK